MKNTVRRLLAIAMAAFMVFTLSGAVFAIDREEASAPIQAKQTVSYDLSGIRNGNTFAVGNNAEDEIAADQIVKIMVVLEDAPAMKVYSDYRAAGSYAASLLVKQDQAVRNIENTLGIQVNVLYNYKLLLNGFSFEGEYRLVEELNRMDGIREAYVAPEWDIPEINLAHSTEMVSAIQAWDLGYTGKGRTVAIIDTGLYCEHPAFANAPEDPHFTQEDIAAKIATGQLQGGSSMNASQVYYSAKIPFRWNYVHNNYDVLHRYNDHGTHVAGIAAGNGGEIVGVAKDAQICGMQVFADSGGAGWTEILAALEDCVVLGVDSANMSLGSPCGFTHYYSPSYAETFENLVNAGVNISASAGNEYSTALGNAWGGGGSNQGYCLVENPDYGVTGAPGTFPRSLSIASVDNVKTSAYYFTWNDTDVNYTENADNVAGIIPTLGGQTVEYVTVPGTGENADYEGIDVTGKVALVRRGNITFVEKAQNAQAHGAIACVVYNNTDGSINMATDPSITIPFVFILKEYGDAMAEAGTGSIFIATEEGVFDNPTGGEPSDFSSWGTTSDLAMKPEITAPGGLIYSSTYPPMSGALYQAWSGTSMSAPHVAGGMAIVSDYVEDMFPNASLAERQSLVDAILMSTANPVNDEGGDMASPRKQGAGMMDLEGATATKAYLTVAGCDRPKLEIGDDPDKTGVYTLTFTVNNFGDEDYSWRVEPHVLIDDLAGIAYGPSGEADDYVIGYTQTSWDITDYCELSGSTVVTVPAHGTHEVTVTVTLTDDIIGYLDEYYTTGAFIEGFVELYGTAGSLGDADGNGTIDVNDALAAMRYALELIDLENPAALDVNGDGQTTLVDALLILRYALGIHEGFSAGDLTPGVDLNIPFLGFYGDWNYNPVFDWGFYYDDFSYGSSPISDNLVGATYGSSVYGLGINPYVATDDFSYYNEDRNAVSPNDDGFLDTTDVLRLSLLRNCAEVTYTLEKADGTVEAQLAHQEDVRKDYYSTSNSSYTNLGSSMGLPRWNAAPYGGEDMIIRIKGLLGNDGAHTTYAFTEDTENFFNEWVIPVYVDIAAPAAEFVSFENGTLKLNVSDEHYVAYVGVYQGQIVNDELVLGDEIDGLGLFEEERGKTTEVTLTGVSDGDLICLGDYAGNEVCLKLENGALVPFAESWSHAGISVPSINMYAYGKNLNTQTWVKFTTDDFSTLYYGGGIQSDNGDYTCGTYTGEYVYAVTSGKQLVRYDASDINAWTNKTTIGAINAGYTVNEMAYNRATGKLYIVVGLAEVYEVNVQTAAVTLVGEAEYGIAAIDFDRQGNCYIVNAFGQFCTFDIATCTEIEVIGYYGINPYGDAGFIPQCGTYADGYFYWMAADCNIQYYNQMHVLCIKASTGEYADLGSVYDGLYPLAMFAYTVELPEQSVNHEDFYENFEGNFDWDTVDADGDGMTWEVKYWANGLYFDGSKAAVSYSWLDVVLYPERHPARQ